MDNFAVQLGDGGMIFPILIMDQTRIIPAVAEELSFEVINDGRTDEDWSQ